MNKAEAREEAARRYGPRKFKLVNDEPNCQVHIAVHGWPCLVVGGRAPTWPEALAKAAEFRMHVHREPGWCIPELPEHTDAGVAKFKSDILSKHDASESGLDILMGTHKDVPFLVEVGKEFQEPDGSQYHGIVLTILKWNPGPYGIVTTARGFGNLNPILVGENNVLDEVSYDLMLAQYRDRNRRRR